VQNGGQTDADEITGGEPLVREPAET